MPLRRHLAAVLLAAPMCAPALAADFGNIELATGQVTVQTQDGRITAPRAGDVVPAGAELVTGASGELHIATEDGGYVAMRPNTRLRIAEFRAEGDELDTQILSLLRGSFRSVTGWIGRHNPERYKITTPTATIGVRGTDHEPGYVAEDDAEALAAGAQPGTYDKVNEGASFIENEAGRVDVQTSQSAFAPRGRARPQRLKAVPKFFHATPNEHRVLVRREQLRQQVERRRNERRDEMKARHERQKERRQERRDERRKR